MISQHNKQDGESAISTIASIEASNALVSQALHELPEQLKSSAKPIWFKKNETVIRKGEPTDLACLLLSGDLMVLNEFSNGNFYAFGHILPGDYVTQLEIISKRMVNAVTLIAVEESFVLKFDMETYIRCLETNEAYYRHIAEKVANVLYDSSSSRGVYLYRKGNNKLIEHLLRYCAEHARGAEAVLVRSTRQQIASEIGVSEKTVSRGIQFLKDNAMVKTVRGKISIAPDMRARMAEFLHDH